MADRGGVQEKPAPWYTQTKLMNLSGFFALLWLLNAGCLAAESKTEVVFNWAFVKQTRDGELQMLDSSRVASIEPGEQLKIFLQPVQNAYIYVYLHDAQNELHLLFPRRIEDLHSRNYGNREYYLPEGEDWFVLDEAKGVEKFHLLASHERFPKLEALTKTYLDLKEKAKSSQDAIRIAMQRVLEEITRIRQQHSKLVVLAEKPVSIAGGVRGQNRAIEELAIEIRAQEFYSKTFRLEH